MSMLRKKQFLDEPKNKYKYFKDTILESDIDVKSFEFDFHNFQPYRCNVGCNTRTRRKSIAIQTACNRNGFGNFRNQYTATIDLKEISSMKQNTNCYNTINIEQPMIASTKSITFNNLNSKNVHVQTTISFNNFLAQDNNKCVGEIQSVIPVNTTRAKEIEKLLLMNDACVETTLNNLTKKSLLVARKRHFVPLFNFSLGTAEYRKLLKDSCQSKLIGGCRVPVCNSLKTRF